MDMLTFERENRERIQAVENSFGPAGTPLCIPCRVLMGQGRLMKQGRRKPEPKDFFLFNDVLVYGSVVLNGRWHRKQRIVSLEDIQLEDLEDGVGMKNQWLIRTPRKSFYVSAPTIEEKRAWMEHIQNCQSNLLQDGSSQSGATFAVTWIPDKAAYKCMRCLNKFTRTNRRHHCRKCGFLVCKACSKHRAVIDHIHPRKRLRVCSLCYIRNEKDEKPLVREDSWTTVNSSSEEDNEAASNEEKEDKETNPSYASSSWLDTRMGTYVYPRPMRERP
ncbi:pleckstrin homology domain-containing family F member 2-like [Etheostoma cragini]|uniref:pleckstrin homology domain-containing family F member 2-like n=1 Tax=Etheostoma cragini TaxID=417921 RepID=UPI00155F1EF7|nr:pleckstrin homology domain-containing family F member 2-like [Etheostoma cragini]